MLYVMTIINYYIELVTFVISTGFTDFSNLRTPAEPDRGVRSGDIFLQLSRALRGGEAPQDYFKCRGNCRSSQNAGK